MRPHRALALAGLALAVGAAPAPAAITSTYSGPPTKILTIDSDDAGDTIAVTCDGGIKVNDAPPPSGAVACTEVFTLLVNGGGGADTLDVSRIEWDDVNIGTTTLDGGEGDDDVRGVGFGSNGYVETVRGGEGNDTVAPNGGEKAQGGNGDDRIVGFQNGGPDGEPMDGGPGTDTHVLESMPNGIDFTLAAADSGLTLTVPGSPGSNNAAWTSIEALDWTLSDSASTVEASGFGGTARVLAKGGSDTLLGTSNADTLDGGAGNDFIDGSSGADVHQGGPGFDLIRARDDHADTGDCGADEDTVVVDALDSFLGCERLDAPAGPPVPAPTPDTTAPALTLAAATVRGQRLRLPVTCPAAETWCSGVLTVTATGRKGSKRRRIRFGPATLSVAGGATTTLTRRLSPVRRRTLRGLTGRRLRVALDVVDAAGNRTQRTQGVALRVR